MTFTAIFRAAAIAAAVVFVWAAIGSDANAQTRTYQCGKVTPVTLNVTGPNSVSAGPIEGQTMQFKNSPQAPLTYREGDYGVIISPDQLRIEVEIADFGIVKCSYQGEAANRPGQPGVGPTDPCGPGFQLAPGTKKCVRRPNVAQGTPQKRPDDPCPANSIQAPETDRCDPAPGAPGPRAPKGGGALPAAGQSLGGILRAGPTQSSPKVMSTAEGDELTILQRGPMWDGYNWFRVEVKGRQGFQWGGIMCSSAPLAGIFQQCQP
jgi:hypothetical protein